MQTLKFKRISSGIYPVLFYINGYYYPVESETFQVLKNNASCPADEFFKQILDLLGHTAYLKEAMEDAIHHAGDPEALARSLQSEIQSL